MRALAADRAVGMPAARGEIVGAYHDRPAVNLAPAADMVGGREARDPSIFVIVREAREAADLAKAAGVEQQIDSLAAGQLAARALADHARIGRLRREAAMRDRLQRLHVGEHWRPGIVAIAAWRGCVTVALSRSDRGDDLARRDNGADLGGPDRGHDAGAGCGDRGFHFHGADDHQRRAGLNRSAGLHRELDDRTRHWAFDALPRRSARPSCPMRSAHAGQAERVLAAAEQPSPAVRAAPAEPEAEASAPVGAASSGYSEKKLVRASPARTAGCERTARSCRRLVGRPAMWNSSSARNVWSSADANECVEFDWQMSLANIGSNCGGGA